MTEKIFVIGHKQPDTDSVISAITYSKLKNFIDESHEYISAISGEINPETKFILEKFGIDTPQIVNEGDDKKIILVDHNEKGQSIFNENSEIIEIIDHHKMGGDISTSNPIYARFEPVGCTATIIKKIYGENNIDIDEVTAKLLISAIISDTLFLKSSTTTKDDKKAIEELNKIANLDLDKFAFEVFDAKGVIANESAEKIFNNDKKEVTLNEKKIVVGQVETVNVEKVMAKKEEIITYMKQEVQTNNYLAGFLMITDIFNELSHVLVVSNDDKLLETMNVKDDMIIMKNVMSRKKDFLPKMYDYI